MNVKEHELQIGDEFDGRGVEIVSIENIPPQISISNSLNQLGKGFILDG